MKRLLIITHEVDEAGDLLGFFVAWIASFAQYFERVDVIAWRTGAYTLPKNVFVHSVDHKKSKIRRYTSLVRLIGRHMPRRGAVFCHMSPIFTLLAWPFSSFRGSRLALWYLHRSRTLRLRLALAVSDIVLTADTASLTIASPKIRAVGHGIASEQFHAQRHWSDIAQRPLHIISVGRLSAIKDFSTLIRAADLVHRKGKPLKVHIIGRAITDEDQKEEANLRNLIQSLGLGDIVKLVGFIPYRDMPQQYTWADVVVGCTPRGGLDKAVLEGMAAGCIPLTSNEAMRASLGCRAEESLFSYGDPSSLVEALLAITDWEGRSKDAIDAVRQHHALPHTISRIAQML